MLVNSKLKIVLFFVALSGILFMVLPITYQESIPSCHGPVLLSSPAQCGGQFSYSTEYKYSIVIKALLHHPVNHDDFDVVANHPELYPIKEYIKPTDLLVRGVIAVIFASASLYMVAHRTSFFK